MKALKFYSSLRLEVSKVSNSAVKEKMGIEDVTVGHTVRVKVTKNKVAPPFRKAEFQVYYDGRKVDQTDEIANIILTQGLIPKYSSDGQLSDKGRTYIFDFEDEHLRVTKQSDLAPALRECPKMKQHFIDLISSGEYLKMSNVQPEPELTEEEFFNSMENDIRNAENAAEELETYSEED